MRPEILYPAFRSVTSLKGVGSKLGKLVEKACGGRLLDLFWHLPAGLIDRRPTPKIAAAPDGVVASLTVRIERHVRPRTPRLPYRVLCSDETGTLALVFFNGKEDWLRANLPEGELRIVSGRVEHYNSQPQMTHPDRIATLEEAHSVLVVEPVYPLTAGLSPKVMARAAAQALEIAPDLPEWLEPSLLAREGWPAWRAALLRLHAPQDEADIAPMTPPRRRLAYDELLANQLALALVRAHTKRLSGRPIRGDGRLRARVLAALPYRPTAAQTQALAEIEQDLASEHRMLRLLQGDVGSGKTLVAFLAMLVVIEAGHQAALMAPTEILARQHHAGLEPLARMAGIRLALLTGRDKGRAREALLADLSAGRIDVVVGTHALFQQDVAFRDLAFAVIDEQHRFGVHQRLMLTSKGLGVDVLAMTATPIPRTLALTAYGDMEVSRLLEKPPGRRPVTTRVLALERLDEVTRAIQRKLAEGARVFWVCPLVEESEAVDLAAAEARHHQLAEMFGAEGVGLVHGRQKGAERDRAMEDFASGRSR
ncbi:MAG: ATP-dependent DNA helicase RecG, partial [Alphaproteobacteria bacterium]|nr:ATP-dependent DNA helicase RecG [Alphaproteobacteria bacterium]